jgi:hypothetical protein
LNPSLRYKTVSFFALIVANSLSADAAEQRPTFSCSGRDTIVVLGHLTSIADGGDGERTVAAPHNCSATTTCRGDSQPELELPLSGLEPTSRTN